MRSFWCRGVVLSFFVFISCSKSGSGSPESPKDPVAAEEKRAEKARRKLNTDPYFLISEKDRQRVFETKDAPLRMGILYFQDDPLHRKTLLEWIKANEGKLLFESEKFGYLETELSWEAAKKTVETAGKVGLGQ